MKKYLSSVLFIFLCTTSAWAHVQLGVKITPGISLNRVYTYPIDTDFRSGKVAFQGSFGLIGDMHIQGNCYVSTGALLAKKQVAIRHLGIQELHILHCFQIPLLFKFYTNEVALDTSIYAEVGILLDFKINDSVAEMQQEGLFIKKNRWIEVPWLMGGGVMYAIGLSSRIFVGLGYQIGLTNMIQEQKESSTRLSCYHDRIRLDIGILF